MKQLLSHEDFRGALKIFLRGNADILSNTPISVEYQEDYRFVIYIDGVFDSVEETIRGVGFRVRQLEKRNREDYI